MNCSRRVIGILLTTTVGCVLSVVVLSGQQTRATAGSDLFKTYCVACHGSNARGTGPLADSLRQRPADLTALKMANQGAFPAEMVARIIDGRNPVKGHGGGDMPVWGEALLNSREGGTEAAVKERIESIVAYIETLQR